MMLNWNGGYGLADWLVLVMAIGFVVMVIVGEARDVDRGRWHRRRRWNRREAAVDKIEDEIAVWIENNQPTETDEPNSDLVESIAQKFEEAGILA